MNINLPYVAGTSGKLRHIFSSHKVISSIPCKGQPEAHYSKFSLKQYFPFHYEHLTLDLTKIHEKHFCPNDEGVATNFHNGGDSSVEL